MIEQQRDQDQQNQYLSNTVQQSQQLDQKQLLEDSKKYMKQFEEEVELKKK